MNIKGKITGIKYKVILSGNLKNIDIKNPNYILEYTKNRQTVYYSRNRWNCNKCF